MNRSILIVICDFLLVSLIAFSKFDDTTRLPAAEAEALAAADAARFDMVSTLQLALGEEQRSRETLETELARRQASIEGQQKQLEDRQAAIQQFEQNLRNLETQTRRLDQERAGLQQQLVAAQTNIQTTRSQAVVSAEQLLAAQADLRKREREAADLKKSLADLDASHKAALTEKQQLNSRLLLAESERRSAAQQLTNMQAEVQAVRQEKAQMQATTTKLAEGVSALAEKSGQLTQEIRENRPLAANAVFSEYSQNRVKVELTSVKAGVFKTKKSDAETILVGAGGQTFAICHLADTPLTFWPPDTDWHALSGFISRDTFSFKLSQISFLTQDPRVAVLPIEAAQAQNLRTKIYKLASDPLKFSDAVLIGVRETYYGECKFQIDPATRGYFKMDRSFIRGLFGKFNPSKGDLVMSKSGELLGIMVNNEYCAVLDKITPSVTIVCGDNLREQQATVLLGQLAARSMNLPLKLQ